MCVRALSLRAYVCLRVCICMCVSVRERERGRENIDVVVG